MNRERRTDLELQEEMDAVVRENGVYGAGLDEYEALLDDLLEGGRMKDPRKSEELVGKEVTIDPFGGFESRYAGETATVEDVYEPSWRKHVNDDVLTLRLQNGAATALPRRQTTGRAS